jgi:hypothetical protein
LASYCGRKRRIARPYRLSPRRLTEKWTSNQSSQRTLGNRPSRRDPFCVPLGVNEAILRDIILLRNYDMKSRSLASFAKHHVLL